MLSQEATGEGLPGWSSGVRGVSDHIRSHTRHHDRVTAQRKLSRVANWPGLPEQYLQPNDAATSSCAVPIIHHEALTTCSKYTDGAAGRAEVPDSGASGAFLLDVFVTYTGGGRAVSQSCLSCSCSFQLIWTTLFSQ